ncbi:hypothetical protein Rru_A0116 [Rhodospirillum rubrum ATCC 11170]|uniref:Uncharacterized protein n=1 Tax=Rhodospirillum rubrum (strain ATCC 11170 / ATH 1.1.1 / DSM 467 / LMG 4362 / NCIMB 8255 / S1) TaxID=269796 RepID=Q2RY74_RHORT|nr:hypothetical protein [Rhodospirillum rubrum]ABC20921.1 hypothetical protein Rru_A0116 [Rhodospirillum rubrum ATCC 11170]MBK5952480.1 hypothetical protein [Rhodospirillum rubrum]QXG80619.1 hypothetical protein KUL73_00590 [Rhodospirillum rubrum]
MRRRWLGLGLALACLGAALALSGQVARESARLDDLERSFRAQSAALAGDRRAQAEGRDLAEAWRKAWARGDLADIDRRGTLDPLPDLAARWRIFAVESTLAPRTSRPVAEGLESVSDTLTLSGQALLDGDILGFAEAVAKAFSPRGGVSGLEIRRSAEAEGIDLASVAQGSEAALLTFELRLRRDGLIWRGPGAPAPDPAPDVIADGESGAPPRALLLGTSREGAAVVAAISAGPWGRPPGWRDLRDLRLDALLWVGPAAWTVWLNGKAYGPLSLAPPHVRLLGASSRGVTLAVERGPGDWRRVGLRPAQTYRVFDDRLEGGL